MEPTGMTRRDLLACAGATIALPSLVAEAAKETAHPEGAEEALARLKEGNRRFAQGNTVHAHQSADWRKHLVGGQKPFATILGCSDSRVPVELVFDQGFGDLFIARVAGNVITTDVVGSLEYAVAHLSTSLIVVLGHQGCGAVTAAVQALNGPTRELPGIKKLVDLIEPGIPEAQPGHTHEQRIDAAVEANVRFSLKQLAQQPDVNAIIAAKKVQLVGAVYELNTGNVRFLDD